MAMGYQRILFISAIMFCYTPTIVQLAGCNNKTGSDLTFLAPEIDNNHPLTSLIVGEWWKVDCRLNNNDVNATVCKIDMFTAPLCENIPDGERIKSKDRNVLFITKLTLDDHGKYYCEACDITRYAGGIEVRVGVAFARPIVTKTPNATISRYGSVVTLECSVKSPMYGMKWLKITPGGPKSLSSIGKNQITIIYNISYLTQKDDGIYLCQIYRHAVKYTANGTIAIKTKAIRPPTFLDFHATAETILLEDESLSVNYTISGTPNPFITWFRSENEREEIITTCPPKSIECKTRFTKNVFTVSNVKYPKDNNVSYKCYAENICGNSSRSFVVIVHSKPYIAPVQERRKIYTKGMQINCTIEKANPKNITFSWHACDPGQSPCAKNKSNEMWKELLKDHSKNQTKYLNSSLVITSQIKGKIIYRCTAQNSVGTDEITFEVIRIGGLFSKASSIDLLTTALPLGSIALAILFVISFVLYKRKKIYGGLYIFSYPPLRDYIDELHPSKGIHEQVHKLPFSPEWEFPREKITLHSELGVGEFGSVWLAHAIGISEFCPRDIQKQRSNRKRFSVFLRRLGTGKNNYVCCKEVTNVAVKKLKENWDRSKLVDLQSELKILIHVGEHENIVNLLGACTKGPSSNLWIIMDYCLHGDLRTFLRHRRDSYDLKATFLAADLSQKLGPRDLVSLAFQIATGMEFLISRKIIHRDLAARNILLGLGYVPKVADFGLAREVFNYDAYVKKSSTLLPLKWMAVESLQYSVFTEKTDVWSFGILLWEIFTLGQSPYPEIHNLDLYKYLLNGKRMDTPVHCPSKISQMMRDCWQGDPNDRPSFANLVKTLDEYETSFPVNQNGEDSDLDQLDELYEADDLGQNKESYLPVIFVEGGEEVQNTSV